MTEQATPQAVMEVLLVETRKMAIQIGELSALVTSMNELKGTVSEHRTNCREDMHLVHNELAKLKDINAAKKAVREVHKTRWWRNPHVWHSAAGWVAIVIALWMGAKGGIH